MAIIASQQPAAPAVPPLPISGTYMQTAANLDDLLRRRPNIALNLFHSDAAYAIEHCPDATDRIIPASLVWQDLDDFICSAYARYNILARCMKPELRLPICVGDHLTFHVTNEKRRGPVAQIVVETWINGVGRAQVYELTLILKEKATPVGTLG